MKLFKRGAIWHVRYSHQGTEYKRSLHARTEKQARRNADALMREVALGRFTPEADRLMFQDMAERLVTDYKVNGRRNLGKLQTVVLKHLRWFENYRAGQITHDLVEKYKAMRLDQDAANASINRELAALGAMFRLCGLAKPKIVKLREDNARQGFVEWGDFIAIRKHLPDVLKRFATVLYVTGWRFSAVSHLMWADITGDCIRLRREWSKNNVAVEFPLNDVLREAIYGVFGSSESVVPEPRLPTRSTVDGVQRLPPDGRRILSRACLSETQRINPYVFPNPRTGQPYKDIRGSWGPACDKAGWRGLLVHDLRRSAVRNMLRAGIPQHIVMSLAGMKTPSIVTRYAIVSGKDRDEAAATIQGYLQQQPQESKVRKIR